MFFSFSQRKKCLLSRVHLLPRSSFGRPRWLPLTVNRAWHSIDPRISFSERIPLTCGRESACEHSLVFKWSCTDQRVLKVSSRVASIKPISGRLKKNFWDWLRLSLSCSSNDIGGLDTRKRQMDKLVLIGVEPRMDPPEIEVSKRTLQRFKLFFITNKKKTKKTRKGEGFDYSS